MAKKELSNFIIGWNVKYPYDKIWRVKNKIPLFSSRHKEMTLVDVWMEIEEDRLYSEARQDHIEKKRLQEEGSILSMRDKPYVPGHGNWLSPAEDSMSEREQEDLFNNIRF